MARPALLFDLDGTLLDTDPLHFAIFRDLFADRGRDIDHRYYLEEIHGRLNADLFGRAFPGEDPAALSDLKEAIFRERMGSSYPAMPGAGDLLARARDAGWHTAVVTNAPRANAEAMLGAIGMAEAFELVVVGEECARGKPFPDPYATAIDRLGSRPELSVAFEDSPSGLASARAAGAFVVGLRSSLDDGALRDAGAHVSIKDYTDPVLDGVLARFPV